VIIVPWQVHSDLAKLREQQFRNEADVIRMRHDARRADREKRRALRAAARLRRVTAEPNHLTKPAEVRQAAEQSRRSLVDAPAAL
jgi:hypothetical protein